MNVLGIKLTSPSTRGLIGVAVAVALFAGLGLVAMHAEYTTPSGVAALTMGALGGALSSACGVDVSKQGWRGAVMTIVFIVSSAAAFLVLKSLAA